MKMQDFKKKQLAIMSRNLKELRRSRRIDQIELADEAGVSISVIRSIEQEISFPRPHTIEVIAQALKCKPEDIIQDKVEAEEDLVSRVYEKMKDLIPQVVTVQMPTTTEVPSHLKSLFTKLEKLDPKKHSVFLDSLERLVDSQASQLEKKTVSRKVK